MQGAPPKGAGKLKTPCARSRAQEGEQEMAQTLSISLVTPTGGYHVKGMVDQVPTSFLVDTGAAVTLLRKETWEHVNRERKAVLEPWAERRLVSVDGSPLSVYGRADVDLTLGNITYHTSVVVVSPLTTEAILGLDFLKHKKVYIDVGNMKLFVGGSNQPLPLHQPDVESQVLCVRVASPIKLPPCSEQMVVAAVEPPDHIEGKMWLLEGSRNKERLPGAAVARALVSPQAGEVPVKLLNPRSEPIIIPAGTKVAELEEIEGPVPEIPIAVASAQADVGSLDPERAAALWSIVEKSGEELSTQEKEEFFLLLCKYADVFASSSTDLGRTGRLKHAIHTKDAPPIRQAVRRIPPQRRKEVQELLANMLRDNVIQQSDSPWASPIVLVRKKDGSLRFCVDYRKLNDVTRKDAYPLPRIDDTLNTLAGSQWFTTVDLLSGYWQVEMAKEDRAKTAFCTTEGLFEFTVMPFGLCNAPATFQRLMDLVLAGLQWSQCLVYLDDVIILGKTFKDHLANLQAVFERLRQAGLKLQPKKCEFLRRKVRYLGHIVSKEGVAADAEKVKKVSSWPAPTTTRDVQQFLGFAGYYRRFVQNFAQIARPLHRLTERATPFKWTQECQDAFEKLRHCLTSAPVLAYPDYSQPFILDTDASNTGIGAVLSQLDEDGKERVIAYASRLLSKPERRYCVTRRELLAAVTFTRHFRPYLLGRHFTLRTDHGSLTWLKNFKEPEGQLARWLERLQEFDFTIIHRRGRKHTNADALSRLPCEQCGRETHETEAIVATTTLSQAKDLRKLQLEDSEVGPVLTARENNTKPSAEEIKAASRNTRRLFQLWDQLLVRDNVLFRKYEHPDESKSTLQLVLPKSKVEDVLRELHEGTVGGHFGEDKTLSRVKERFYWPGHYTDVQNWCRTCVDCAKRKTPAPKARAPLNSIKVGSPLQLVAVDILGPLPESATGNRYILVVGDYFSRWMEAYAIPNQEAVTVSKKLTEEFFLRFSPPEQLHSDQGRQFESELVAEVCKLLGIAKTRTTPYHPQSDGLVERFNRTLLTMLATIAERKPFEWEDHLRSLCMAYNSSVHPTTGYSPFFLMFGRRARLPIDLIYELPSQNKPVSPATFATTLQETLAEAYHQVREHMSHKLDRQKTIYDRKVHGKQFKEGDLVWLHTPAVPKGVARKFHRPWTGPYKVVRRISDATYRIQDVKSRRHRPVVHFDRLKKCPEDVRLPPSIPRRLKRDISSSSQHLMGTNLEMVEDSSPPTSPPPEPPPSHRYPRRNRAPPTYLLPLVEH